jgi:hypothetical protein
MEIAMHTSRDTRRSRWLLVAGLAAAASGLLHSTEARAYSGSEHMRFPDQAYQIMNILRRGGGGFYAVDAGQPPLTTCPSSICTPAACPGGCAGGSTCAACTQWNRFMTQLVAAPPKLDNVLVDLPDPTLSAPDCAGVFPTLPQGKHLAACRAGDLSFPVRRGWGDNGNECFLRPGYLSGGADQKSPEDHDIRPFFQDLPSNYTGALLGKWATGPDDEFHDTALWFRPTNIVLLSDIKGLAEGAVDVGLTIILAPFVCLGEFIFGGDNCISDAENAAHVADPVTIVDEELGILELDLAGAGTITSNDSPLKGNVILQGLWHFASVAKSGQFNHVPGYKAVDADITASGGPTGWSPLDTTVIALCDLLGLTIHPIKSTGVPHYSPYADGDTRTIGDWIDPTMAHAEFEPVDNLARWGWDQFTSHAANARGLGWVLHAIGDAGQPHHTAAVLGFGHGPWERFALLAWQGNFSEQDVVQHYPHIATTLGYAFRWWKFLDDLQASRGTTALPVGDMIEALAQETFALPVTHYGRAFQQVTFLDTPSPDDSDIHNSYDGEKVAMRDLMERAIGASIAFLAKASDFVPAAPNSPCACAPGSSRLGRTLAGDAIPSRDGACHPCGTDVFAALPDWVDGMCVAVCPPDQPTLQGGLCTSTGACPSTTPFVENGVCVAQCSATEVVVNHRNCTAGGCPANTTADAQRFCVPQPPPKSPAICGSASGDSTAACCSQDGGLCVKDADCCSQSCRSDGICRTSAGGVCGIDNDCLSQSCLGTVCQPGSPGQACSTGKDCVSNKCVNKICAPGDPGAPCNGSGDCASGICSEGHTCIGRAGDPCRINDDCNSDVCAGGTCAGVNGESCTSNAGCVSGQCVSSICKGGTGAVCQGNSGCISGRCEQFVCKAGPGGICQVSSDCGNGLACPSPGGRCCGVVGSSCNVTPDCCGGVCDTSRSIPGVCATSIPVP